MIWKKLYILKNIMKIENLISINLHQFSTGQNNRAKIITYNTEEVSFTAKMLAAVGDACTADI
jgi:hypothetical protein